VRVRKPTVWIFCVSLNPNLTDHVRSLQAASQMKTAADVTREAFLAGLQVSCISLDLLEERNQMLLS